MPDHHDDVVVRVILEDVRGPESRDITRGLHVDFVSEHLEVVTGETLGITPTDGRFVLPVPHLHGEIFAAKLLEREFTEISDAFDIKIVRSLNNCLMMCPLSIDFVRRVEIHYTLVIC